MRIPLLRRDTKKNLPSSKGRHLAKGAEGVGAIANAMRADRNENSRCKTANLPFTTVANKRIRAVARSTTVFRASTKIDEETGKDRGYCPELSNIACPPVRLYCIGTARPMLPAGNGALQRNFRKPL
ncbi:hypothetical protein V1477_009528 [Vespula maculifrons]|uniref:Uncharacterized protein n=2 Tax=Vespula TaxID=7451 RepID=A0A834N900_VESGE|nr:hypothetical protein HZH68_007911 [Vespula germanica]